MFGLNELPKLLEDVCDTINACVRQSCDSLIYMLRALYSTSLRSSISRNEI